MDNKLLMLAVNKAEEEFRTIENTHFWNMLIKEVKGAFDSSYKMLRTTGDKDRMKYSQGELDAYERVLGMPKTILDRLRRK